MKKHSTAWIYLAGAIALIGAAIHLVAIFAGAGWYRFFGAPPLVVESARSGTLLAPIGAMLIAVLMALCASYAFSALDLIRRMPLLRLMLAGMASVCLVRSLVLLPLSMSHPELRNTFEVVAAVLWGLAGVGFLVGYYHSQLVTTKNAAVNATVNTV